LETCAAAISASSVIIPAPSRDCAARARGKLRSNGNRLVPVVLVDAYDAQSIHAQSHAALDSGFANLLAF
jgi:hypothetical protein